MAKIIGLPKLSPTMEEGTLVRWAKAEGDAIEVDDLLAEVETDKATMEFRSFDRGYLLALLAPEGQVLRPDQPVAIVGQKGEDITALRASVGGVAPPASAASPAPAASAQATTASAATVPAAPAAASAPAATVDPDARVLASPLVRRVAREQGIDLRGVSGSGPHGRIIKRDLDEPTAPAAGATVVAVPVTGRQPARVEKPSSMRRTIARRLGESKRNVPHYYLTLDLDASALVDARAQLNASLEAQGEKVSVNDLVIKACALALRRSPGVNASWVDDQLQFHQVVDVSVAVAVPDGLVTPVVRDADAKTVLAIAREVRELAAKAKAKKLMPEEMTGGTFSISNLGMFGIDSFAAVINPPEGAILAVGAVRDEPVVRDGAVVAGKKMSVTLSADHRVIDGATGAKFLALVRGYLESPVTMLA